jgi:hypothetical protein
MRARIGELTFLFCGDIQPHPHWTAAKTDKELARAPEGLLVTMRSELWRGVKNELEKNTSSTLLTSHHIITARFPRFETGSLVCLAVARFPRFETGSLVCPVTL